MNEKDDILVALGADCCSFDLCDRRATKRAIVQINVDEKVKGIGGKWPPTHSFCKTHADLLVKHGIGVIVGDL